MSILSSGNKKNITVIEYKGKALSLNDFYSQGHWSKRSSVKNKYKAIFTALIEDSPLAWMDKFYLIITYNSRHDPDNVVGMEKIFVDTLKQDTRDGDIIKDGYIIDDNKNFFKGLCIFPDDTLDRNTFRFILIDKND